MQRKLFRTSLDGSWLVLAWSFFVVAEYLILGAYSSAPSEKCNPLLQWPENSMLSRDGKYPTLLVFIHPFCPCSQASISELERILAECPRQLHCNILFGCPKDQVSSWLSSSLACRCKSIACVKTRLDLGGETAVRFGVTTSGHCLLYSESGALLFQGGITSERGHEGESLGRIAIRQILSGKTMDLGSYPVFGCELVLANPNQTNAGMRNLSEADNLSCEQAHPDLERNAN